MPRLPADLEHRLICPQCSVALKELSCPRCSVEYPDIDGVPVLVDPASSVLDVESIVERSGASPIGRPAQQSTGRLSEGTNPVATRHLEAMLRIIPDCGRILVIGGAIAGKGADPVYESHCEVIGLDIYASHLTHVVADAHKIPFADQSFDAVLVQAVLEHVLDPGKVVAEIWRVLKPDGVVYAETAFMQQVHEAAFDFTRFTESGHRWLFRSFSLLDSGAVAGPGYQMIWSVDYLFRGLFRSKRFGLMVRKIIGPLRILDRYIGQGYAIDGASAVYFFGQRSGTPLEPQQVVAHYRGAQ
jgi:SAM-dependent methyltransferase